MVKGGKNVEKKKYILTIHKLAWTHKNIQVLFDTEQQSYTGAILKVVIRKKYVILISRRHFSPTLETNKICNNLSSYINRFFIISHKMAQYI